MTAPASQREPATGAEMAPAGHPFDRAVALVRFDAVIRGAPMRWRGHTSADYANLIGPYGGITAAQALQAVMLHPDRLGEPVAFTSNFAAAMADGEFVVEARPVRTNRSTQHWIVTLHQLDDDGRESMVFTATAITARRRRTWGATDVRRPPAPAPDQVARVPHESRPAWFARYDMRWLAGPMPSVWDGSEAGDSLTRLWVRDDPPRAFDFPGLLALCDVFYPRVWLRRARMTPIGTVSFTVYFHVEGTGLATCGSDYLLAQARGQRFFDGYFDHRGEVWSPHGDLLATTHQVVYYRD